MNTATVVVLAVIAGVGPGCSSPIVKTTDTKDLPMTEKLREIVEKAIDHPEDHATLELDYARGHDLSGVTRFTVHADGSYTLSSSVTRDEQKHEWSGKLDDPDRKALLRAVDETGLLVVPSSTRNLADDEEPIIVTLRDERLVHELRVWHDDAGPSGFYRFEAHVIPLVKKLSGGEILTIAAR